MKSKSSPVRKIGITVSIIVAIIVIIWITVLLVPSQKSTYSTVQVHPMNVTETVNATGQVVADQEAILAFDTPGTIAEINVQVGDIVKKGQVLGSLSSDILAANLESAQANEVAAEATLVQTQQGSRPEELAVYQQKFTDATTAFQNAMHDAYLKTQEAIEQDTDVLFTNGGSVNPEINIPTQNDTIKNNVDWERLVAGEKITNLGVLVNANSSSTISLVTEGAASDTLNYAKKFLGDLSDAVNQLSQTGNALSQTQINNDRGVVNTAASEVNVAAAEFVSAQSAYNDAHDALTLEQAGNTPEDIQTQQAKTAAAQASVDTVQSQLNHTVIRAPFDGIVTDVAHKVGEVVSAGTPAFTMITPTLKVETQVTENDIAKITLNDSATITLDAYGANVPFNATVTEIDPAETVTNGINTYKVTFHFSTPDTRIRSGMTTNASIVTNESENTLAVPTQAIITKGTDTFVLAEGSNGQFTDVPVQIGITGSDGYTTITSGLNDGESIASFGNTQ